jgi:hypothetical protein
LRKYPKADEALMRSIVLPEEDRIRITNMPWAGGYRWFRSPNVIPLEQFCRPTGAVDGSQAA